MYCKGVHTDDFLDKNVVFGSKQVFLLLSKLNIIDISVVLGHMIKQKKTLLLGNLENINSLK